MAASCASSSRRPGQPGEDVVLGLDIAMQEFVARRCRARAQRRLRAARRGDRRRARDGVEPELRSDAVLDRADAGGCGRSCRPIQRNPLTDKAIGRRLSARLDVQAGRRAGRARSRRRSRRRPRSPAPAISTSATRPSIAGRSGGHGTLRLRDAIKQSCDVFFYETARRLGIDRLAAMARRFGFGSPLGLDIPGERGGLIPSREWKLATDRRRLADRARR